MSGFKFGEWVTEKDRTGQYVTGGGHGPHLVLFDTTLAWVDGGALSAYTPPPADDEVEVRIAVAVEAKGDWLAGWGSNAPDASTMDALADIANENGGTYRVSWITARVPKPQAPVTIRGEVERG